MNIAIIPARGGSKRIPRKNIKLFKGKPMIYWPIKAAISSNCFERIIVSTDDDEIASISKMFGAEVPFKRPSKLSDDFANTLDVIKHSLSWLKDSGCSINNACCIYATAPLIFQSDICKGKDILDKSEEDVVVFSATSFPFPIQRAIFIDNNGYSKMFYPNHFNSRSQDLKESFHDAGQFYWASRLVWSKTENLIEKSKPLLIPRWRVQDIDNQEDWKRAELIHDLINN